MTRVTEDGATVASPLAPPPASATPSATPRTSAVEVWVAPLLMPAAVFSSLVASLSPSERELGARFRFTADARRFSAARGWLRRILAGELGIAPAAVPLVVGPHGKPQLDGVSGVTFNVSHAADLALVAVARDREVGVDVEPVDAGRHWGEIAEPACTEREAAALNALVLEERPGAFLRLWTAKEAYAKATGLGLTFPPDQIEVGEASTDGFTRVWITGDAPEASPWTVRYLRPAPGYFGAVAAEGMTWTVTLRTAAELKQPSAGQD